MRLKKEVFQQNTKLSNGDNNKIEKGNAGRNPGEIISRQEFLLSKLLEPQGHFGQLRNPPSI